MPENDSITGCPLRAPLGEREWYYLIFSGKDQENCLLRELPLFTDRVKELLSLIIRPFMRNGAGAANAIGIRDITGRPMEPGGVRSKGAGINSLSLFLNRL
jgi:hypothetical protein